MIINRLSGSIEQPAGGTWLKLRMEMDRVWQNQRVWLITGETGTGKHYLIQQLLEGHQVSERQRIDFHCATQAESVEQHLQQLLQQRWCIGGNSLQQKIIWHVLHEVEALNFHQQRLLLQLLEADANGMPGHGLPDLRWLLTSQMELSRAVEQQQFLPGLYYRMSLFQYRLAPLREQRQELQTFIREFVRQFSQTHQKKIERIDHGWLNVMLEYSWPGNIRELKYAVEQAVLLAHNGILSTEQIPQQLRWTIPGSERTVGDGRPDTSDPASNVPSAEDDPGTLQQSVNQTEKQQIEQALERNFFSRTRTAEELGISRVTLYNKMKKLGLETSKDRPA